MREIKFAGHIKFDGIDALLKKHILDNLPDVFSVKQINSDEYDIFKDMLLWMPKPDLPKVTELPEIEEKQETLVRETKPKKAHNTWFKEEEDILRKMYAFESKEAILEALPNRNWPVIQNKAYMMDLSRGNRKNPSKLEKKKRRMEKYSKDSLYMKKVNTFESIPKKKCILCNSTDAEQGEDYCEQCAKAMEKNSEAIFR